MLISPRWISGVGWADAEVHTDLRSIEIVEAPAWDLGTPIDWGCTASVAEAKTVLKELRRAERRETSAGKSVLNGSE